MFIAFWGEQQAAVAIVTAVCIFLRAVGVRSLTVSDEAG
jgi:hypothetical protein